MIKQTKSGNWAKSVIITVGVKWRHVGLAKTRDGAEALLAPHVEKGRKVRIEERVTSKSNENKRRRDARNFSPDGTYTGPRVGDVYYAAQAYIEHRREVMVHMTQAECLERGLTPGSANKTAI